MVMIMVREIRDNVRPLAIAVGGSLAGSNPVFNNMRVFMYSTHMAGLEQDVCHHARKCTVGLLCTSVLKCDVHLVSVS